jgi:hypothetical protein
MRFLDLNLVPKGITGTFLLGHSLVHITVRSSNIYGPVILSSAGLFLVMGRLHTHPVQHGIKVFGAKDFSFTSHSKNVANEFGDLTKVIGYMELNAQLSTLINSHTNSHCSKLVLIASEIVPCVY